MPAGVRPPHLVYGPVPSRRLGRSLGVDLVPFKTCTYDCIYCQLGRTTCKTVRRRRWTDPLEVAAQVRDRLATGPDVIALAGSGEPTLEAGIGEVIAAIKDVSDVPVAVITNGSLLGRPRVRRALAAADVVLPSLDAPDEERFRAVNRPHPSLTFTEVVEGMVAFREGFTGQLWLEVMLLGGGGAEPAASLERLAHLAARIAPDRIQLNTAVRPPAEPAVAPLAAGPLRELAGLFTPHAEVIAEPVPGGGGRTAAQADVLALLSRRPCTAADIATGLGIHRNEAIKAAAALVAAGAATLQTHGGRSFYVAATASPEDRTKEKPRR